MDELKRLLVLSGQREKYAPVVEGVILHVREKGKEIMNLRLEGMMAMRPMVTTLRANGFDDLQYSDQELNHQDVGDDMDYGDEEDGDEEDGELGEESLSNAQEAAALFAQLDLEDADVPDDMTEKLANLTICLADLVTQFGGGEDNELGDDDDGSSKYKDFDYEMHPDDKNYPDFDVRLKEGALKGHPYQDKTDDELKYIQKDAHAAAKAMQGNDSKAEAKYLDQVNDASTVLYQRKNKKKTESLEERELQKDEKSNLDALKKKHEGGSMEKSMIDQYGEEKGKSIFYGKLTKMAKEGVEELDELSKKTLGSYAKKASHDAIVAVGTAIAHKDKKVQAKNVDRANKRIIGHDTAVAKLAKEEGAKGRTRDTKHTGGLSKGINKAEQKALKGKERQAGKKEAGVEEHLGAYASKADNKKNKAPEMKTKKHSTKGTTLYSLDGTYWSNSEAHAKSSYVKRNTPVGEAAVDVTYLDNENMPANAVDDKQQKDERTGQAQRTGTPNKVPKEVMTMIDKRIGEIKNSIERYDNKGFNEKGMKVNAIECLEQIKKNLGRGDYEGFMEAQIFYGTLMSPITDLFPGQLVNYLHKGSDQG